MLVILTVAAAASLLAQSVVTRRILLPHSSQGVAINFVTNDDERLLQDIQRFYNTVIEVGGSTERHHGTRRLPGC